MKKTNTLLSLVLSSLVFSQVGVGTSNPTSILDVAIERDINGNILDKSRPYGFQAPRLTLAELSNLTAVYNNNHIGALIYITDVSGVTGTGQREYITDEGYYYFDGSFWQNMVTSISNIVSLSSIVDPNILGYIPSITTTASSVGVPTIAGANVTKFSTATYLGNGHSYALYNVDKALTWYEAYNAAKELGGYLATFTTRDEWLYVEANVIKDFPNRGWIGMAKFNWNAGAGLVPNPEMKWITGEQPNHDYAAGGTAAVRKYHNFASGEPNNSGDNEGFVSFYSNVQHTWNDGPANNNIVGYGFIVEFQQ